MTETEQQEKRQFSVPSRDELIQSIKDLDEEIDHVTLNLIKCDFNATEKDIEKTFPEFKFIKVKNYNPGSFEVVFQMRIDAINFIRNHYDKKILNRRFFIKMGRQQKQVIEDWTGVGSVPRQFRGPNKPHFNQNKPGQQRPRRPEDAKTEEKTEEQTTEEKPTTQQQVKPTQVKPTQVKPVTKEETKAEQPKKEGKVIPKFDNHHKKPEHRKPHHEGGEKKTEGHVKKEGQHHYVKKQETHQAPKKEEHHYVAKKEGDKKEVPHKKQEVHHKKEEVHKKEEKADKKPQQPKEQPPKEDDGWITVGGGKNQKRR